MQRKQRYDLLFHAFFLLFKTDTHITDRATRLPSVQSEIWMCYASSSFELRTSQ